MADGNPNSCVVNLKYSGKPHPHVNLIEHANEVSELVESLVKKGIQSLGTLKPEVETEPLTLLSLALTVSNELRNVSFKLRRVLIKNLGRNDLPAELNKVTRELSRLSTLLGDSLEEDFEKTRNQLSSALEAVTKQARLLSKALTKPTDGTQALNLVIIEAIERLAIVTETVPVRIEFEGFSEKQFQDYFQEVVDNTIQKVFALNVHEPAVFRDYSHQIHLCLADVLELGNRLFEKSDDFDKEDIQLILLRTSYFIENVVGYLDRSTRRAVQADIVQDSNKMLIKEVHNTAVDVSAALRSSPNVTPEVNDIVLYAFTFLVCVSRRFARELSFISKAYS